MSTPYTFQSHDVLQIKKGEAWLDFSTLRTIEEAAQAIALVNSGRWEGETVEFRIVRHETVPARHRMENVVKYDATMIVDSPVSDYRRPRGVTEPAVLCYVANCNASVTVAACGKGINTLRDFYTTEPANATCEDCRRVLDAVNAPVELPDAQLSSIRDLKHTAHEKMTALRDRAILAEFQGRDDDAEFYKGSCEGYFIAWMALRALGNDGRRETTTFDAWWNRIGNIRITAALAPSTKEG